MTRLPSPASVAAERLGTFEGLGEGDVFVFLNKAEDVAVFTTGPAAIALAAGIDVKRGAVIVVEGTEAFELFAGRVQSDIGADDIDNVVGFLDPFGQASPIVRQKTPVGR